MAGGSSSGVGGAGAGIVARDDLDLPVQALRLLDGPLGGLLAVHERPQPPADGALLAGNLAGVAGRVDHDGVGELPGRGDLDVPLVWRGRRIGVAG